MDIVGTTGAALQFAVTIFQALQLVDAALKGKKDEPVNTMRTVAAVTEKECDAFLLQYNGAAASTTGTAVQDACAIAQHAKAVCKELLRKVAKLHPQKKNPLTLSRALLSAMWSKDELVELQNSLDSCMQVLDRFRAQQGRDTFDAAFAALKIADGKLDQIGAKSDKLADLHATEAALSSARWDQQAAQTKAALLLAALEFDGMGQRFGEVPGAAEDTFHWILKYQGAEEEVEEEGKEEEEEYGQSAFAAWLARGDGIFHIAGKPGSGKSTLMKYVVEQDETTVLLQQWAGDKTLVQASCFFWKPGAKLQRTTIGLMRTLLYGIVAADYGVAEILFPDVWHAPGVGTKKKLVLTDAKVRSAFHRLADAGALAGDHADYRFCFFIDGLDEFGDNSNDTIVRLIWQLKKIVHNAAGRLKMCVSSREYPEIVEGLAADEEHRITLQELTKSDIELLVDQRFREIFEGDDEGETDNDDDGNDDDDSHRAPLERKCVPELRDLILRRAQGVFLWVVLVLSIVEQEAVLGTSPSELRQLVKAQHDGLEEFFNAIIDRIESRNRTKVALMFRHTLDASGASNYLRSITWYTFLQEFSSNDDFSTQCDKVKQHLATSGASLARLDATKKWAKRHCEGLLDVVTEPQGPQSHGITYVVLSHRSIFEFLTSLLETRWKDTISGIDRASVAARILHAMFHTEALYYSLVKGADLMLKFYFHLQTAPGSDATRMRENFALVAATEETRFQKAWDPMPMVTVFATDTSCHEYVHWKNQACPRELAGKECTKLLVGFISSLRFLESPADRILLTILRLLESGASLSHIFDTRSNARNLWLVLLIAILKHWRTHSAELAELLVLFLRIRPPLPMYIFADNGSVAVELQGTVRFLSIGESAFVINTFEKPPGARLPRAVLLNDVVSKLDTPRKAEILSLVEELEPPEVRQERMAWLLQADILTQLAEGKRKPQAVGDWDS